MALPTTNVSSGNATVYVDFAAEVINKEIVEICSRATGYIQSIPVKEGALVKKGQVIMQIDPSEYKQSVNAASALVKSCEAQLVNASLEIEKLTPLVEKNIISQFQLDAAKANEQAAKASLLQAQAQLSNAEIQLSYTSIKSPMTGYIGRISVYAGSLISVGSSITTVAEKNDALAYFSFDEKKMLSMTSDTISFEDAVKELHEAQFIMSDGTVYPYRGIVEVASGIINSNTGSTQLKATFPNESQIIRSGATGKVRIPIEYEDVILVPEKATYELQNKVMVYTVTADSLLSTKVINILGRADGNYIVESGVEVGQQIITEGINKVQEGMKISPKKQ